MSIKIYHNPRCSKSRATLALLQDRGFKTQVIKYLETKPGYDELSDLVKKLGIEPRQLLRTGEPEYRQLGLDDVEVSDREILLAVAKHPILMQRPVVVSNNRARIGRPPEAVLEILE